MVKIAITGASGLLGWHFRAFFKTKPEVEVAAIGREDFSNPNHLQSLLSDCDYVLHFAAKIRGEDCDILEENRVISRRLAEGLSRSGKLKYVVFASSTLTLSNKHSAYGQSKKEAAEYFENWCSTKKIGYKVLNLPNIFGEFGRPHHNSVISTFCYNISNEIPPPFIDDEAKVSFLHAQRVCEIVWSELQTPTNATQIEFKSTEIKVAILYEQLLSYFNKIKEMRIPDLRSPIDRNLYNTLRSYMFPAFAVQTPTLHQDARGELFEVVKDENGGQVFVSSTVPGVTRGNHFHTDKIERFCVLSGEARISLRKLFDSKKHDFYVSGAKPQFVDIPTFYTHNITNVGKTAMVTLFWTNEIFDPNRADTFLEPV